MIGTLYILTGPTAVGKTQLALGWAEANDAEIVSCDSLLFYRGMDIGTAKPIREELEQIPHHCIDLVEPSQQFNIGQYTEVAKDAVKDILSRGKRVLVTGGSGFYVKSFVAPVVDGIEIPANIETEVDQLFEDKGLGGVVDLLKTVSPEDVELIDLQNSRRVIPALKRCLTTGKTISELRKQVSEQNFPFKGWLVKSVLLQRSLESLQQRIEQRTQMMLKMGLIDEVKRLIELGIEENPSASLSIGYREVIAHLRGELDLCELEELININTLKLVKKQGKWFRHQMSFDRILDLDRETPSSEDLFQMEGACE